MTWRHDAIAIRKVRKSFALGRGGGGSASLPVLEDISLRVAPSEIVCILGPSGCGKTTLLNLVAGFDFPTAGEVIVHGRQVSGPGVGRAVIFQQDTLFPWLSLRQNVLFGPRCRRVASGDEVDRVLEIVGLRGFERFYPHEVSGGMKQRAALARVLVNSADVLLMDEPFGALDAQSREEMQELLLGICGRLRPTVLAVTHDVGEAVFLADRVLAMTPRPAKICAEFAVPLDRPRRPEMRESAALLNLKQELRSLLRNHTSKPRVDPGGS